MWMASLVMLIKDRDDSHDHYKDDHPAHNHHHGHLGHDNDGYSELIAWGKEQEEGEGGLRGI